MTDERACADAVERGVAQFGRLDVLVNNAGITHRSPFQATQTEVLRRVMDVNLFGAIHLTRAALPHLKRTRGLIVALSSVAGFTPLIARTGYSASKHALHGFFESLRTELAPDGVGVMMVCPSFIATGIDRHALGPTGGKPRPTRRWSSAADCSPTTSRTASCAQHDASAACCWSAARLARRGGSAGSRRRSTSA